MSALITVLAHGARQDVFDMNLPMWEHHGHKILVACPADDPVKTTHETWAFGRSSHNGPNTELRLRELIRNLAAQPYDRHLIHEHDSFCLSPEIPWAPGMRGNMFVNTEHRFQAMAYPNPPWMVDWTSMKKLARQLDRHEQPVGFGFNDRIFGELALWARVPVLPYCPQGVYTDNLTPAMFPEINAKIDAGCVMVHGVKTADVFAFILAARSRFLERARSSRTG